MRSSSLPTNNSLRPGPRSAGAASANRATSTPLGMIRNSPPIRARSKSAARSDTAIRTARWAAARRSSGAARSYRRARVAPEWKVPTTGARASSVAHNPVEGAIGWCAWTTSGPNVASSRRTIRRDHGRGSIGALDSL